MSLCPTALPGFAIILPKVCLKGWANKSITREITAFPEKIKGEIAMCSAVKVKEGSRDQTPLPVWKIGIECLGYGGRNSLFMTKIKLGWLPSSLNWREVILAGFLIFLVAGIVPRVFDRAGEISPLSPQSKYMLDRSNSLYGTIDPKIYPGVLWPPGYPLVLLTARYFQFPVERVNLLLFVFTLGLVYLVSRISFTNISPSWPAILFGVCAFNYYNLQQYTSEALVLPLSMLILLSLGTYLRRQSIWILFLLALSCSLLFITRYHALLWLAPIVLANLIYKKYKQRTMSFAHLMVFLIIAFVPLCVVLYFNYLNTGFLTGMERFGWSNREEAPYIEYFMQSTTLAENLRRTVMGYFLDFGSPFVHASHLVLRSDYRLTFAEIGFAFFLVTALGALVFMSAGHARKKDVLQPIPSGEGQNPLMTLLIIEFFLTYILVTLIFWTVGNNDPLYSRYLYPSYIYLILGAFSGYSFVKQYSTSFLPKIPFWVLLASMLIINVYKIIHTIFLQDKLVRLILGGAV